MTRAGSRSPAQVAHLRELDALEVRRAEASLAQLRERQRAAAQAVQALAAAPTPGAPAIARARSRLRQLDAAVKEAERALVALARRLRVAPSGDVP